MTLDDEQIERYSRQLILAEVGPRGQQRLGTARIAVSGDGVAAGRVVAHLAAAGVGWIAADAALHAFADTAQPDLRIVALAAATGDLDAAIVTGDDVETVAAALPAWRARAAAVYWIASGWIASGWIAPGSIASGSIGGGAAPCPRCAAAALAAGECAEVAPELAALRAAVLGTVVATEVVKGLLAIGTPLAGRIVSYDPATATITSRDVPARHDCPCRANVSRP